MVLVRHTASPPSCHCVKSIQIWSFFWSVFFRIRTEYGEIRKISLYSVQMRENTDQKKLRIWTLFTQCVLFFLPPLSCQQWCLNRYKNINLHLNSLSRQSFYLRFPWVWRYENILDWNQCARDLHLLNHTNCSKKLE